MYFYEEIKNILTAQAYRYAAEMEVVRFMYDYALRATEVINNDKHISITSNEVTILGAKKGDSRTITDATERANIALFVKRWNNNYLKLSFSKLKRYCDYLFSMYICDRRTNSVSTHILRFAKAQEVYMLTKDVQAVMDVLREKSQHNAEIYISTTFSKTNGTQFDNLNY